MITFPEQDEYDTTSSTMSLEDITIFLCWN